MDWDIEVDVVCAGSGSGGLGAAILAMDAGGSAFVANSGGCFGRRLNDVGGGRWSPTPVGQRGPVERGLADRATYRYLKALTEDVPHRMTGDLDTNSCLFLQDDDRGVPPTSGGGQHVPPFCGSHLRDWAAECVVSPDGFLYSRVNGFDMTPVRSHTGSVVNATTIGSLPIDLDAPQPMLNQWLFAQACRRGILLHHNSYLRRLVFEDGLVAGAVFDTPTSTCAVRAAHGVLVGTDGVYSEIAESAAPSGQRATPAQVCIVGKSVSRFGKVQLVVQESPSRSSSITNFSPHAGARRRP
jgi:hypothetical protein